MGKRASLKRQMVDALNKQARFGQSKHAAKAQERERCARDGDRWNPSRAPGIYSVKTMESYKKEAVRFTEWAKVNHGCRYLEETKAHVSQYLKEGIDRGLSPWTLQLQRAALRKGLEDNRLGADVKMPIRHREDVIRSRGDKAMDREFSEARNKDMVDFCRASGLRRHELAELKVGDVRKGEDGKWYVHVEQGKGGRPREAPVLDRLSLRVEEITQGKDPDALLFERVPVRADVHGYRREYAAERYQELAGRPYDRDDRNNIDRDAIRQISQDLGHNREDVVTRSYLD